MALLCLIVLAALLPRAWASLDYGRNWYGEGQLTLVNFDEAGSCRAALGAFDYSPLVGWQTLALGRLSGATPPADAFAAYSQAKAWCQSEAQLLVARLYSVVCGTATVLVLWWLSTLLLPGRPLVAPLAASLLALSGWHISESLPGTVDAASTFFIYLFLAAAVWAQRLGGWRWLLGFAALVPAVATKYWVFAGLAAAVLIPAEVYVRCLTGVSRPRGLLLLLGYAGLFGVVTNLATPTELRVFAPLGFYLLVPWRKLSAVGCGLLLLAPWLALLALQSGSFVALTSAGLEGRFGTDYGAIGSNKWLRNGLNLPIVLVIGLGVPASLCALLGLRTLWRQDSFDRAWLVLMPLPAFALYMLFLAPVTYYRHYLPLLPAFCLLAALGVSGLRSAYRGPLVALLLCWQGLLAVDLVSDYHFDPRRALPAWYVAYQPRTVLTSYYVNPPPRTAAGHALLSPAQQNSHAQLLAQADTLILSENWYDTAFANELNGPLTHDLQRLIKTTPSAARFYRRLLAGEDPRFQRVAEFRAPTFMPELLAHRWAYGSFTQFVGDILIFRVRP